MTSFQETAMIRMTNELGRLSKGVQQPMICMVNGPGRFKGPEAKVCRKLTNHRYGVTVSDKLEKLDSNLTELQLSSLIYVYQDVDLSIIQYLSIYI